MVLNLAGMYAAKRKPRRTIPSSLPNLLASPYMVEQLVKDIYKVDLDEVKTIGIRGANAGTVQGNLSDSGRVQVTVRFYSSSKPDLAVNWFVKIMPEDDLTNNNNGEFNVFTNEIEIYQKIIPEMKAFLTKEGCSELLDNFDVPEILYSKQDDTGAILVLDDVSAYGYGHTRDDNGDKYLSVEQAVEAVSSIAKIHAISVAVQSKCNVDLAEEHPFLAEAGMLWTQADMSTRLFAMKDSYCEFLKQSEEVDSPTLLARFRECFDSKERLIYLCRKRCQSASSKKSWSLQHGDFHFNNLMFKREAGGRMRVKIVDWQLAYMGQSTGDLSYLLMSSLSKQDREEHEEHIKNEYFAAYMSTLKKLSNLGVEKNRFDSEYTDSLPLSFFLSCGNIMALQEQDRSVKFSYDMCKEAVLKEII